MEVPVKGETSKKKKISIDLDCLLGVVLAGKIRFTDRRCCYGRRPGLESIDIGGSLPTLTLKNEKGEDVQIADLANKKSVVLFLVPKADTACGFRDIYPDFSSLNFDVYCLGADTSTAQAKWQTKKELPYPLISDPKRSLIAALGAAEGGKTKRSHFVFAKGGKLVDKKIPVKPVDSPRLALEFIKSIQEGGEAPAS
ncbi:hypothetical protein EST38_g10257 [Candolleomyces aberdarensis]|uniref:Alkyl hydroperoxide reductase subunit C/ Thiol specific antioxidant domain-containing protein n=1 Tax=Candolleomyces aberdarensis TaxID=2316362 RepID=A0A4V1Q2M4_9AGAR|nr:hypothetical protein EST38_g10257 [Candolleomyces aberdarensis]